MTLGGKDLGHHHAGEWRRGRLETIELKARHGQARPDSRASHGTSTQSLSQE